MWLFTAAVQGDVERAKKCISDGANVNYQDEVSYHIEGSVVNEMLFTCTKLTVVLDLYLDQSSFETIYRINSHCIIFIL